MNCLFLYYRQQSKLLSLLSSLDNELHSVGTSTPHGHSPLSRRKAFLQDSDKNFEPVENVNDPKEITVIQNSKADESVNVQLQEKGSKDSSRDQYETQTPATEEKNVILFNSNRESQHFSRPQSSWEPLHVPDVLSVSTNDTFPAIKLPSKDCIMPHSSTGFFASIQKESVSREEDSFWDSPRLTRPSSSRTTGERGKLNRASTDVASKDLSERGKCTESIHKEVDDWIKSTDESRSRLHTGIIKSNERGDSDLDLLPFHKSSRGSRSRSRRDSDEADTKDTPDPACDALAQANSLLRSSRTAPISDLVDKTDTKLPNPSHASSPKVRSDLVDKYDTKFQKPSHASSPKARIKTAVLHKGKLPRPLVPSADVGKNHKHEYDSGMQPPFTEVRVLIHGVCACFFVIFSCTIILICIALPSL